MYILNPQKTSKVCEKYAEKMDLGEKDYFRKCIDEPIAIEICMENLNYLNRMFGTNVKTLKEFERMTKREHSGIHKNVKAQQKRKWWKNHILNMYFYYNDLGVPRLFKYRSRILNYDEYLEEFNNERYDLRIAEYNIIRDVLF